MQLRWRTVGLAVWGLGWVGGMLVGAQERTEQTGSVTGKVLCTDTNDPARMAKVQMEAVKSAGAEKKAGRGEGTRWSG